jgi:hypothetical protein
MANIIGTWKDTTTNKETLKTLVRSYFDNTDTKPLVEWPNVMKDIKTGDQYEREFRMAGLGPMAQADEGQNLPIETPKFDIKLDFTQVRYGNGFRITDAMKRFNKFGAVQKFTTSLKKTMQEGKDIEVAKMYNDAAATLTGFDTLHLAEALHTCLDSATTTFSNYLDADLTAAGYESALAYFDAIYNDQGQIFVHQPRKLVVNKAFRVKAFQITGADKKPFEQSNTNYKLNSYYNWDVQPFVYHRLTSATSWFLIGDVGDDNFGPRVYTALEPDIKVVDAADRTRDTEVTSQQYFKYGFTDARLVYVGNL